MVQRLFEDRSISAHHSSVLHCTMTRLYFSIVLLCALPYLALSSTIKTLTERFYQTLDKNSAVACFRLTDATHQIGCSASTSSVQGVLFYVNSPSDLNKLLQSAPHPPFIALLEPQYFTNDTVMDLYRSPRVNGIVIRYRDGSSAPDISLMLNLTVDDHSQRLEKLEGALARMEMLDQNEFSPERKCPNDGFGSGKCGHSWNPTGSEMSFMDFKDFPIFAVENKTFSDEILQCYRSHNVGLTGAVTDYPLCSIELYADMDAAVDTPTCFRRASLPIPYLSNVGYCDPLGDQNVWGTMYQLRPPVPEIIMLAAKVDSNSFFLDQSYGANSEVAGIVTLLAVVDQLGRLKRNSTIELNGTRNFIMYTFFHGESWDYIGSSRMVYDMQQNVFPNSIDDSKLQLPLIGLENITTFFELSQLGMDTDTDTLYIHGSMSSPLVSVLRDTLQASNLTLSSSSTNGLCNLPPASLQRFLRPRSEPCESSSFKGSVLATYDQTFTNRFYHSRLDNLYNLQSVFSFEEVAGRLADIATGIARGAVNASEPICSSGSCDYDAMDEVLKANSTLIKELLECFLVKPNCTLFQNVLTRQLAELHLKQRKDPLSRYITTSSFINIETILIYQLAALLGAHYQDNITNYVPCSECSGRFDTNDQTKNITAMQWLSIEDDKCLCIESYTYQHKAESPAFDRQEYDSREYSTWAESRWSAISARIYLVTHWGLEVAILIGGTVLTAVTFIIAFLCKRRADDIFEPKLYGLLQQ